MKVGLSDTFFDSVKRMINRQRWYWKTWDFLRYDMPNFFKNVWRFRSALYSHRWYSGEHAVLPFMKTAIDHMADKIEKYGMEVDESRLKKVEKMKRASYLLQCCIEDSFIELAEAELGELKHRDWEFEETGDTMDNPLGEKDEKLYRLVDNETEEEKAHNSKVFSRARELEAQMWEELWTIIRGQDHNEFIAIANKVKSDEDGTDGSWNKWFDGSDLRGWWD